MSEETVTGDVPIRAALDRSLTDLEARVASRVEDVSTISDDRMSVMANTTPNGKGANGANGKNVNGASANVRTAAGQNADNDMRGSQLQTSLDRGDYGSQAEEVGKQKEERSRTPESSKKPGTLGLQMDSIDKDYDDSKYILARKISAINTLSHLMPPSEVARLIKAAGDEMGASGPMSQPLGGEPDSVANSQDAAAGGDAPPMNDDGAPATAPASDPVQNLQEVIRQKEEDKKDLERQLASADEVLKQLNSVLPEAISGPDAGKEARRQSNGVAKSRTAVDKTPEIKPGGGAMKADKFSYQDAGSYDAKYKGAADADDALSNQAGQSDAKPVEDKSNDADSEHTSLRDAGDYPTRRRLGGRPQVTTPNTNGQTVAKFDWSGYDRVVTAEGDQELQPQGPIDEHGTYDAAEMGDTTDEVGKDISKGTTPNQSAETESVVNDANRETKSRATESQRGSTVGSKVPAVAEKIAIFDANEIERLKKECKHVDDVKDALHERTAQARKLLINGEKIVEAMKPRLALLHNCGNAIEAVVKADKGDRVAIREKTKQVLVLASKECKEAIREMVFVEAALVEAKRAHEHQSRLGPAFALAVHQIKANLVNVDELPAKIAEYTAMDRTSFELVAKTVQETSARARATNKPKTAGRLPSVAEDNLFKSVDEMNGIFG